MRGLKQERGFTIVEMMVAVVVLLVGALGTLAMLDTANKRSRTAADRQNGTAVARQVLEAAKSIPYRDVAPGTLVSTLREDEALAGISEDPWRIERDNTTFTIEAEVCWLDEPRDGLGSRAPGNFCPGSGAGGTDDGNSIDHKRVTVVTSWNNDAGAGSSRQSTLISARGGIDAPGVLSVQLVSPATSPITDPLTTSASFTVATNEDATAVVWSLDGAQQETAAGGPRDWTFTWELPPIDGVYDVSAQAFDSEGLGGEVRSTTIIVNRFPPAAPQNMEAARKDSMVEATWSAGRERDVIGYRVYRQGVGNASAEVACDFTTETTCVDPSPPARTGAVLDYWVVAIDTDPQGEQREGAPSNTVDVNAPNTPPNQPVDLILSKDVDGNNVLQWTAPPVPDPDGDVIQSYIVYRNGTAIADRYDELAGTETTFVDHATNGVLTHEYWVTAVDDHFAESSPLGPVSG
jgi:prepilin-type N-terminal cleavage/methylation domain-containing protein